MVDVPVISKFLIIAFYTFVRPRTMVLLCFILLTTFLLFHSFCAIIYINFMPLEIHKKVSSKEVVRGPMSAVTLNSPKAEDTEKKSCCKNI